MLVTTCLFVCQDSIARILLKAYPATEIAFARFFVHMVVVSVFIAWRDPRLMISRRPMLQMLRSSFLLGGTLFGMFALKIMPFVDFSAIVWFAPVLIAALSVFILHEKVSPSVWVSVIAGLMGVWVLIGQTGMDFSLSMLFPCLAALANALYQIATRWVMAHDSPATGIVFAALLGSLGTTAILPFIWVTPKSLADLAMLLALGCFGGLGHFLVIKAFQAAPASVIAPLGYVELIGTATLGYLIFANFPDALTWVGALIIIASGLYIAMRERRRLGIR